MPLAVKIKIVITFLLCLLLSACQIASPTKTAETFLEALSQNQYDQALEMVIIQDKTTSQLRLLAEEEKQNWINKTQTKLGQIKQYNLQSTIALEEDVLVQFGVKQGYEVYYSLDSERSGYQNQKVYLFRINGDWRILVPNLSPKNAPQ